MTPLDTLAGMDSIAFIGGGHMAAALIGGLVRAGHDPARLLVVEPVAEQRSRLAGQFGVQALDRAQASLREAGLVVWAVKPQNFPEAAAACQGWLQGALQLSVMAGIRSEAIVQASGSAQVVRAMPNTPALIGRGIAGLYARETVSPAQRALVERVLAPTGALLWVAQEQDLDAVTALSGSGPAYVFYFLEAMMQAAAEMGLTPEQGRQLALSTFEGATALAAQSPLPPQELRAQVTSKGGTTYAALSSMESDGVKPAFVKAMHAARLRAKALGEPG